MEYKPLPSILSIRDSDIHGQGLFLDEGQVLIPEQNLGISHIELDVDDPLYEWFKCHLIRTPLGGFINHSDDPNCYLLKRDNVYRLCTLKKIVGPCELTLDYNNTDCGKDQLRFFDENFKVESSSCNSVMTKQHGGNHYKDLAIQPIEYIMKNNLSFCEGNVVKYVTRHHFKNGAEDLKKAIHNLEFLLKYVYGENI